MTEYKRTEYRGLTIVSYYDEEPENPRTWDNVATFVCKHRSYDLGDEQDIEGCVEGLLEEYVPAKAIIEYFVKTRNAHLVSGEEDSRCNQYYEYEVTLRGEKYTCHIDADTGDSEDDIAYQMGQELDWSEKLELIEATGEVVMLPISMYEHSGITLWLGSKWGHPDAQWDCSSIGFAFVEKKTAEKEMSQRILPDGQKNDWKEWAYTIMEGEMKTYDQYLRGEVYGYMIEDEEGEVASNVYLCGCWGYYDENHLLEDAKGNIDTYLEEKDKQRKENLQTLNMNLAKIHGLMFADDENVYRISQDLFGICYIERAVVKHNVCDKFASMSLSELSDEMLEVIALTIKRIEIKNK